MARGDIRIQDTGGRNVVPVRRFPVESGQTAINAGEPVMVATAGELDAPLDVYVIALTDGLPLSTNSYFVGIAAADGTHTSSADGYVDVYLDLPGIIYAAKQKNTAGLSQAEIDLGTFKRYVFDLTSSSYTLDDTGTAVSSNNGLIIVGGNPDSDEWYFTTASSATWRKDQ